MFLGPPCSLFFYLSILGFPSENTLPMVFEGRGAWLLQVELLATWGKSVGGVAWSTSPLPYRVLHTIALENFLGTR